VPCCVAHQAVAIVGGDVVTDLVATRPDPRADDGGKLASEGRDARFDDPFEQTTSAGM